MLASILLLGLSSIALADPIPASWSETLDFNPDIGFSSDFTSITYVHDLTNDGFAPLDDILLFLELTINLFDDNDRGGEAAYLDLPGLFGDRVFFDLSGDESGGLSLAGWAELNVFGTLTVTVDRIWGDFTLGDSTLTGYGVTNSVPDVTHSVPEPGTLALLGIGLFGMGLARRRRKV